MLDLNEILDTPLPATLKGLAASAVGKPLRRLGSLGLSILADDVPFPVALLKESALAHNTTWMARFAERAGVSLCPHGKTTMAPQLFDRQLAAGAWGMTAATASHVRTYRRFGVSRIILANQLVGRSNIELVLDELEADGSLELYLLVDSLACLRLLEEAVSTRTVSRPLRLLLEVGAIGGRTGVRSTEEGVALGRAVRNASPSLELRGIEAFEGTSMSDGADVETAVHRLLGRVVDLCRTGIEERWFARGEIVVTGGGSAFFDLAARELTGLGERDVRTVLRSGCYVSHDALHYEPMQPRIRERSAALFGSGPGLVNALEVWSVVQSVPEPGRAIVALGKRDISYDLEVPKPLWWYRPGLHDRPEPVPEAIRVSALNDQHAYLDGPSLRDLWQVGDLVGFGVGHPCTTFDKWPLLYVVDDGYRVVDGIRTYF